MKTKELELFVEKRMLDDLKQYVKDKTELGVTIDNIGLFMCLVKSQESLQNFFKQSKVEYSSDIINNILKKAYAKVYAKMFEATETSLSNFKSIFVGTIRLYNRCEENNSIDLFQINLIAGKAPTALLIHREESENSDLFLDKTYLIKCKQCDFGNDIKGKFDYEAVKELNAMEILQAVDKLGEPQIIDIN